MYEKPTNLFLYIPPTSAHSPGVLKSIIFGNVHHYWCQNSNIDDYQCIIQQFALRLEAHGHAKVDLIPIFRKPSQPLRKHLLPISPTTQLSLMILSSSIWSTILKVSLIMIVIMLFMTLLLDTVVSTDL
jgi:ABC-type uncharacterized transport system permease subunit